MAIQNNNASNSSASKKTADAWVNCPVYIKDKHGNEHFLGKMALPLYNDDPVQAAVIAKRTAEGNGTESDLSFIVIPDVHVVAPKSEDPIEL